MSAQLQFVVSKTMHAASSRIVSSCSHGYCERLSVMFTAVEVNCRAWGEKEKGLLQKSNAHVCDWWTSALVGKVYTLLEQKKMFFKKTIISGSYLNGNRKPGWRKSNPRIYIFLWDDPWKLRKKRQLYRFMFFHRQYWSAKRELRCCTHVHIIACCVTFGLADIALLLFLMGSSVCNT